jgi:hypothetical protein
VQHARAHREAERRYHGQESHRPLHQEPVVHQKRSAVAI